jgi:chlorite dismutase
LLINSSLQAATPEETRAIEKDAWLYAFPMMKSYNTWYLQAVDSKSPTYVGGSYRYSKQ